MPGQGLAHLLNCLDDGFGESALLHQVTHPGADLLPECVAALFVNAQVAHNRELARARDQVDQDRVAMTGFGHAQFEEPLLRKYQRVGPLAMRNINANFAGGFALSLGDRIDDFGFVQLAGKFFRSHVASPASARAAPPPQLPPPEPHPPPPHQPPELPQPRRWYTVPRPARTTRLKIRITTINQKSTNSELMPRPLFRATV